MSRTLGPICSCANLETVSAMRDSVSVRCEMGVGVRSVRSTSRRRGVVEKVRGMLYLSSVSPLVYAAQRERTVE